MLAVRVVLDEESAKEISSGSSLQLKSVIGWGQDGYSVKTINLDPFHVVK